jgi:hypothetical protein
VNNTTIRWNDILKPCKLCGYCPYGRLLEEYPLRDAKESCGILGHDCPVYYIAEPFTEESGQPTDEEYIKHNEELKNNVQKQIRGRLRR